MNKELPYEIIARVLSGEATAQERNELEKWQNLSNENKEAFEQMKVLWTQAMANDFEPNTEEALKTVSAKIGGKKKKIRPLQLLLQVAAVAIIFIATGVYLKHELTPSRYQIFHAGVHEKKSIVLEDGTNVTLNENSTLTYPEHFDDTVRAVTLEGEAYFDVNHNPKKPFVIKAGESQTRVLGTAFIVRARPDEKEITVSVHRGKVAFSQASAQVILTIGEKGTLDKTTGSVTEKYNDNLNDLSWQTNMLTFVGTPLNKVAGQLSEFYKVQVSLSSSELDSVKFSGQFYDKKIDEVLKNIELATGHEFVKDGVGYRLK